MSNNTLTIGELKALISEEYQSERLQRGFLLESPEDLEERQSIANAVYPFKAIFLFGPAGAGKSFISNQVGIPKYEDDKHGFRTINPDQRIEDVFPAFGLSMKFATAEDDEELEAAQQGLRGNAQNWSQKHTENLILSAKPLLFDTTGEDVPKMSKRIKELQKLGYRVGVLMVNVPTDISVDRDSNRDRTVGKERTTQISSDYQKFVVKERGYFKALAGTGADIFGEDIYPNVYDLRNGQPLDGVTPEHIEALGNPTPESAKALLEKIKKDVDAFLNPGEQNFTEVGLKIYNAMKIMVKGTGGARGQNMAQLEEIWGDDFQSKYPDVANNEDVQEAAKYLLSLDGGSVGQSRRSQRSYKDKAPKSSVRSRMGKDPVPVGGKLRPDKDGTVRTRRWEESLEESVSDVIKNAILEIKKTLGD